MNGLSKSDASEFESDAMSCTVGPTSESESSTKAGGPLSLLSLSHAKLSQGCGVTHPRSC